MLVAAMTRGWFAAVFIAFAAAAMADPASSIAVGTTVTVRANSIWFQQREMLSRWQQLKRSGSVEDVADYEHEVLGQREAWQFTNPLTVKVIGYDAEHGQANIEMQTPGRMQGTTWFVDAGVIER
jgi:hypothetical protein